MKMYLLESKDDGNIFHAISHHGCFAVLGIDSILKYTNTEESLKHFHDSYILIEFAKIDLAELFSKSELGAIPNSGDSTVVNKPEQVKKLNDETTLIGQITKYSNIIFGFITMTGSNKKEVEHFNNYS
jgi:hypothetical protein